MSSQPVEPVEALLFRAQRQLMAWAQKYGQHDPKWLPPNGDVKLQEDIDAYLAARSPSTGDATAHA